MLRLPDGMRDLIKAAAEENNRSMNAEIVARLEMSFSDGTTSDDKIPAELIEQVAQGIVDRLMVSPHMQTTLEALRERLKQE